MRLVHHRFGVRALSLVLALAASGPVASLVRAQGAAPVSEQPAKTGDGSSSYAAALTDEQTAQARELFKTAQRAFNGGKYADALGNFQAAYNISRVPALLYNIGVSAERMLDYKTALDAFERYLVLEPNSENEVEVRSRIEALKLGVKREQDAAAESERLRLERDADAQRVRAVIATAQSRHTQRSRAAWSLTGAGLAVSGVGAVMMAKGSSLAKGINSIDLGEGVSWTSRREDARRAKTFRATGLALVGVGGAAAVGGVLWMLIDKKPEYYDDRPVSVSISPTGVFVEGAF